MEDEPTVFAISRLREEMTERSSMNSERHKKAIYELECIKGLLIAIVVILSVIAWRLP